MPFDSRRTRNLVAATGGVALAALLAAGPAHADGDMWNSMLGWVGMGHKANASTNGPDDGAIDYTPKPALVVPPKMDLPPPQASTSTPADWPHDPDATARVKAEAELAASGTIQRFELRQLERRLCGRRGQGEAG